MHKHILLAGGFGITAIISFVVSICSDFIMGSATFHFWDRKKKKGKKNTHPREDYIDLKGGDHNG